MKKKYYAILINGKLEEGAWNGEYVIYSSKFYAKNALRYWSNCEKPYKLKIVEIRIGKEIKL